MEQSFVLEGSCAVVNEAPAHDQTAYENMVGLIHQTARRCYARIQACRLPMEYEDVLQEVHLSWWLAKQSFDPESGNRFTTYFVWSAYNNMNKLVEKGVRQNHELGLTSYDDEVGELGSTLEEFLGSDEDGPEQVFDRWERVNETLGSLSPLASLAASWLAFPPEFVVDEFKSVRAKVELARDKGESRRAPAELTLKLVLDCLCKALELNKQDRNRIMRELKRVAK